MPITCWTITDDTSGARVTGSRERVMEAIRDWFPEAPAEVAEAIDRLDGQLARGEVFGETAAFLAVTVAELFPDDVRGVAELFDPELSSSEFAEDVTPEIHQAAMAEVRDYYGADIAELSEEELDSEVRETACKMAAQAWVDLGNRVLRARYPLVVFCHPASDDWDSLVHGLRWPIVSELVDYEAVYTATVAQLREMLGDA